MPVFDGQPVGASPRARLAAKVLALCGWRTVLVKPVPEKAVIIFYPHTSNWDFVIGLLAKWALDLDVHWVGKDSLFRSPLQALFRRWGGIAVDRSARTGSIARLADEFSARKRFLLALAPEGTRQRAEQWRSGFYHLALAAGVPLALAFVDYPRREVGVAGYLNLTGDEGARHGGHRRVLRRQDGKAARIAEPYPVRERAALRLSALGVRGGCT